MAAWVDLSGCDRVSMSAALNSGSRAVRVLLLGSSGAIPPRPMLWPCAGELLNAQHDLDPVVAPDIDLLVVHGAVVGGAGAQLKLGDAYVHADGPYPTYVRYWCDNDITPQAWAFDAPARLSLPRAYVITHFNYVWGHWLTEMYPKLFLMRDLIASGLSAPLLLPESAPAYVASIARALIPELEIITYNPARQAVAVGTALLPHMLHREYAFHDFLRWALEREALAWPPAAAPDKVFVSRAGLRAGQGFRELVNEVEIEAIAQELGLTILRPETLPWAEQARIFSRARVVAGEFGSGLHNALLSPAGCQVVSLNWLVEVQSRIGHFRRHDVGYILPDDDRPRLHSLTAEAQPFRIDPGVFRDRLAQAIERAQARSSLAGWEEGPVATPGLRL